MSDIQLFSYPTSPYAQKVACYLNYKQIDFKFIGVNPITNAEIAFTEQRQVPVLKIGNDWRKESSELGIWLEQLYPQRPILPDDAVQRAQILEVDKWISNHLIPSGFRYAVEWQNTWNSVTNGWRLARAVHCARTLPLYARLIWPWAVKRAPFITKMVKQLDLNESMTDMNQRLQQEFIEHLKQKPYLGASSSISLADLSAFPIITSGYFMGMRGRQSLIAHPEIHAWAVRVYEQLPHNPLLIADHLIERKLA